MPNYPDTSALAELIRKQAYYNAGGQDEGQSALEKINSIFNTINTGANTNLAYQKQKEEALNKEMERRKTFAEIPKINQETVKSGNENRPYVDQFGTPSIKADIQTAQNQPIPLEDLRSGNLDTRQKALDSIKQRALDLQSKYGNLTTNQVATNAAAGLKEAQTVTAADPTRKTIGMVMPSMTPEQITATFGEGITKDTPFIVARQLGDLRNRKEDKSKLFPVAGLSPLAQQAAANAGMGAFVTERQARILNQGNLPTPATADEIKDVSRMDTIKTNIDSINKLVQETGHAGIGIDKYFVDTLGQYSPIDAFKTDPKTVELYRLLNDVNNQLIYLYSGKQINESEYQRLKSTFPDPKLNPEAFDVRLRSFGDQFNSFSQTQKGYIEKSGRRGISGGSEVPQVGLEEKKAALRKKLGL